MDTQGKTALVTGGAHRLGRAFCLTLASAGCDVVVHYNSSADEAERTAAAVRGLGRRAAIVQGDVSSPSDIPRIIAAAEGLGRLDILVNSASVFERAAFQDITADDWDRVLGINLRGPFMMAQAAAPLMRAGGGGVIVNIVDLSALQPWPSYAHHAVSKAGLLHLTRIMARALGPDIRVNSIAPGTVLPPEGTPAEEGSERRIVARPGNPDDVGDALLFLVSSDFVTGENLVVDGGRMLL